jgi:DNA repair exonuclease SbcCD ATPase subunit
MRIQKLKVKNFYSFRDLEIDFKDYTGIVRLVGKNKDAGGSNGSGKSSIFESVLFGLFGKTIRRSTEESLVNTYSKKELLVDLSLESGGQSIQILRTKRPTSLNLLVDGVNKNKESATETQKYIEELLQIDYKSFMSSVVFGQHSELSFLDSSPEDKRNIIKNCFNLEEFFSKRDAVKELKSSYSVEIKTWTAVNDSLKKSKGEMESHIPDKKYKYVELPDLGSILEAEKSISSLESEVKSLQDELRSFKDKLKKTDDSLSLGEFKESKECPVCKAPYIKCQTNEDVWNLKLSKENLLKSIQSNSDQVATLKDKISSLKPKIGSKDWAAYNDKNKLVLEAQRYIDRLEEISRQIKENDARINELTQKLEVMKFWELAFSEKGIVRYIIRNILEYFNLKSNEYVSILTNNQFSIEFSDDLSETIKNNGIEVKYISLSGGEKRKLNLAIMLALQDLSSRVSRTDCDVVFFDEVCDNIDDTGIFAIHNLLLSLREQYPNKKLFLITHNNKLSELLNETQEIRIVKEKGISSIQP